MASLARFLAGTSKEKKSTTTSRTDEAPAEDEDEEEDEELEMGDLDWSREFVVDKRLAPLEMAKLWKGVFFCSLTLFFLACTISVADVGGRIRFLDVG